ncbi:hypothetical protein [Cetobacterium sp.]|uniref:pyocin knob domain-containing protein n=1 Tax=Cetobacterium sp. TaxID=2071632 RepID=UPI003F668C8F
MINLKLPHGGYGGTGQELKTDINSKVSKLGDTMSGTLNINADIAIASKSQALLKGTGLAGGMYFGQGPDYLGIVNKANNDWLHRWYDNGNYNCAGSLTAKKFLGPIEGNATTATKLLSAINVSIGDTTKKFDGGTNLSYTVDEIGAVRFTNQYLIKYKPLEELKIYNLDEITTPGNYVCHDGRMSVTNFPPQLGSLSGISFNLTVESLYSGTSGSYKMQTFKALSGHIYFRTWTANGWNSWKVNYSENNKPTAADVGLNLVDNTADSSKNVLTATKLKTKRKINGTYFDGDGDITTASWGAARSITIGNLTKSINGSENISYSLSEIGAIPTSKIGTGNGGLIYGQIPVVGGDGVMEIGKYIDMRASNTVTDYDVRITCTEKGRLDIPADIYLTRVFEGGKRVYSPNNCPFRIGDYIISENVNNPSTEYIGTSWIKIEGRYLKGVSGSEAVGGQGGANSKIISVDNMPSHGHNYSRYGLTSGGGIALNIEPAYRTVNMWRRTA